MTTAWRHVKRGVVRILGRSTANRISRPFHDWLARQRTLAFLSRLPDADLRLNIGCGARTLPGWINLDSARGPQVDLVWDIRKGLPFRTGSCTVVLGEHVIEHLTKADGEAFTKECFRVLQRGGVLRLSTPDAGRYLRSYAGDGEFLRDPRFEVPAETPLDRVNLMMREGGQHLWSYDFESLASLLKKAGFVRMVEQRFGVSEHRCMRGIDAPERAFESLYVEAVK